MARRRMLLVEFVDQDRFVNLPDRAKLLYIYFATHADDEGFVCAAEKLMRLVGTSQKMLQKLVDEGFLIKFESGVYLVVDWLLHNTIRKDRSVRTLYLHERSLVKVNSSGQYYLAGDAVTTECQPDDNQMPTQNRIEENRIEENRIEDNRIDHNRIDPIRPECVPFGREPAEAGISAEETPEGAQAPQMSDIYDYCCKENLNVDTALFYACYAPKGWKIDGKPMTDWKQVLRIWDQSSRNLPSM